MLVVREAEPGGVGASVKFYKIRHKATGLYRERGNDNKFSETGCSYEKVGYARIVLSTWRRSKSRWEGYQDQHGWKNPYRNIDPENWEIVEFKLVETRTFDK